MDSYSIMRSSEERKKKTKNWRTMTGIQIGRECRLLGATTMRMKLMEVMPTSTRVVIPSLPFWRRVGQSIRGV